jgi:hypothetical protein
MPEWRVTRIVDASVGQVLHTVWCGDGEGRINLPVFQERASAPISESVGLSWEPHGVSTRDFNRWADESFGIAKRFVYDREDLDAVRAQEAVPSRPFEPIKLWDAYFTRAGRPARARTALCGARLTSLVKDCVTPR